MRKNLRAGNKWMLMGALICALGFTSLFLSASTARAEERSSQDDKYLAMVINGNITVYYDDLEKAFSACSGKKDVTLKLVKDVVMSGAKYIGDDMNGVTLDLNGYSLARNLNSEVREGEVILILEGADFHIINSRPDSDNPYTKVKGGCIYGGKATDAAGGIQISRGAKLTTENVNICYNRTTSRGGGIFVARGSQLIMKGGSVSANMAHKASGSGSEGGAIDNQGTIDCSGVKFDGNFSLRKGGAIYHQGEKMVLRSCTVTGSRSEDCGGGIAIDAENVDMLDCVVEGNSAKHDGGGIWVNNHKCFLAGGSIRKNMADYGGGVYVDSKYDIGIQGKLVIEENKTTSDKASDLVLQTGVASKARAYNGGLLPGSRIGLDRTKSLSENGIQMVINVTDYELEQGYFFADRGSLRLNDKKEKQEVFMATAFDQYGWAIILFIVLEIIGGVCGIRVLKKKIVRGKISQIGGGKL